MLRWLRSRLWPIWKPVATDHCWTTFVDVGRRSMHAVVFEQDERGRRRMRLLSSGDDYGCWKRHPWVSNARTAWEIHGVLPESAIRVREPTSAKIIQLVRPQ